MSDVLVAIKGGGGTGSDELTATKAQVLENYTAVTKDSDDEAAAGTMKHLTNRATITHTADNATKVIEGDAAFAATNSDGTDRVEIRYSGDAGYITPNTLFGVAKSVMAAAIGATAGIIKAGSSILGIAGAFTSDGTITAADVISGKIGYSKGAKVPGNMAEYGGLTKAASHWSGNGNVYFGFARGAYRTLAPGDSNYAQVYRTAAELGITGGKILEGQSILGIPGEIPRMSGSTITPSASQQTVSCSGKYMTGNVVVNPIPSTYLAPGNWTVFNYGAFPINGLGLAPYYCTTPGATYPTSTVTNHELHEYTDDGLRIAYAGSDGVGNSLYFNKLFPIKKLKNVSYVVNAGRTTTNDNYAIMVYMYFAYKNSDGNYTVYWKKMIVNQQGGYPSTLRDYSETIDLTDILSDCPYEELAIGFGTAGTRTLAYLKSFSFEF